MLNTFQIQKEKHQEPRNIKLLDTFCLCSDESGAGNRGNGEI